MGQNGPCDSHCFSIARMHVESLQGVVRSEQRLAHILELIRTHVQVGQGDETAKSVRLQTRQSVGLKPQSLQFAETVEQAWLERRQLVRL